MAVGEIEVAVGEMPVDVGGTLVAVGGIGVFVAVGTTGKLVESPGNVRLFISCRLVNPSPSESMFSINPKAAKFLPAAL